MVGAVQETLFNIISKTFAPKKKKMNKSGEDINFC